MFCRFCCILRRVASHCFSCCASVICAQSHRLRYLSFSHHPSSRALCVRYRYYRYILQSCGSHVVFVILQSCGILPPDCELVPCSQPTKDGRLYLLIWQCLLTVHIPERCHKDLASPGLGVFTVSRQGRRVVFMTPGLGANTPTRAQRHACSTTGQRLGTPGLGANTPMRGSVVRHSTAGDARADERTSERADERTSGRANERTSERADERTKDEQIIRATPALLALAGQGVQGKCETRAMPRHAGKRETRAMPRHAGSTQGLYEYKQY
jgi:hypothetical protein